MKITGAIDAVGKRKGEGKGFSSMVNKVMIINWNVNFGRKLAKKGIPRVKCPGEGEKVRALNLRRR